MDEYRSFGAEFFFQQSPMDISDIAEDYFGAVFWRLLANWEILFQNVVSFIPFFQEGFAFDPS